MTETTDYEVISVTRTMMIAWNCVALECENCKFTSSRPTDFKFYECPGWTICKTCHKEWLDHEGSTP